jgi:hypothetical protein
MGMTGFALFHTRRTKAAKTLQVFAAGDFSKQRRMWTFGENQSNRRLFLSKVSWVYIFRRELLQGRRYRPT